MLFRPCYCCNCGDRIERTNWRLWTSRRFCDLCSTDFQLTEMIPRAIVVFAGVICLLGVVNYFAGGTRRPEVTAARVLERQVPSKNVNETQRPTTGVQNQPAAPVEPPPQANTAGTMPAARPLLSAPAASQVSKPVVETSAPVYFCGAETRKGTPCSRKVKGNVRCWQHTGMPAMLPPDKLLASR